MIGTRLAFAITAISAILVIPATDLNAQSVRRADRRLVDQASVWATRRGLRDSIITGNESSLGRTLDSLGTRERHGHALTGALLGLGLGAGAGYLVATERVGAIRNGQHDGPFQEVDYLIDPVIGGVLGAIIGGLIGAHVH